MADAQRKAGKDYTYRLHIRRPQPDFELRVVPSSIAAPPGTTVPITVHALKKEGFDQDIALNLDEPPPGFILSGAWVPAGQDKVGLTLTVPSTPTGEHVSLQLEGRSRGRGRKVTRLAVPADQMMQAFIYQHLVPAKDWTVFVSGSGPSKPKPRLQFDTRAPARLMAGETVQLLGLPIGKLPLESIVLELHEPPDGISVEGVEPEGAGLAVKIKTDAQKVQSGLKGNLIFDAFREWTTPATETRPATTRRSPLGIQPAVPFEVIVPRGSTRRSRS
jgi:hypothetical protein